MTRGLAGSAVALLTSEEGREADPACNIDGGRIPPSAAAALTTVAPLLRQANGSSLISPKLVRLGASVVGGTSVTLIPGLTSSSGTSVKRAFGSGVARRNGSAISESTCKTLTGGGEVSHGGRRCRCFSSMPSSSLEYTLASSSSSETDGGVECALMSITSPPK